MVHISLPHRISQRGSSKTKEPTAAPAGEVDRRPSPTGYSSSGSTLAAGDQKPLILKVYVVKVRRR